MSGESGVTARWVAIAETQWELRGADGKKLGSLVRFEATDTGEGPTWAALPRGGRYLQPQAELRAAAETLLEQLRR
jgi:hypothetical protein